jgi:hypothetical protein
MFAPFPFVSGSSGAGARSRSLTAMGVHGIAELRKQAAVDVIPAGIWVFWMPLNTEGEGRCLGNTDGFNDTIIADGFDENPVAWSVNCLRME